MNTDWRPAEGSFKAIWRDRKKSKNKSLWLRRLINRLPNYTYPRGEKAYWKSVDHYGCQAVFSPHNAWRFFWHSLGGFFLAMSLAIFIPILWSAIAIFLAAACKEYIDDVQDQNGKIEPKNFLDALSWSLGGFLLLSLKLVIA